MRFKKDGLTKKYKLLCYTYSFFTT